MKRTVTCVVITLLSGLLVCASFIFKPDFVQEWELRTYDMRMESRKPMPTPQKVAIVAIDAESIQKVGAFPWSRATMAKLARQLDSYSPAAVGYDLPFAQPEEGTASHPEPDKEFAAALENSKTPQVLSYFANLPDIPTATRGIPNAGTYSFRDTDQFTATEMDRAVGTLPLLAQSAHSQGYRSILTDVDGSVRRYSMALRYVNTYYQPLAAAVAAAAGAYTPQRITSPDKPSLGIWFGETLVPVDPQAETLLNYRGPSQAIPYIPAWKVLSGEAGKEQLEGKFLLVGTTAAELKDTRVTPLDISFPGVEIHATALDNILAGDPLVRKDWGSGVELCMILLMTLVGATLGCMLTRIKGFIFLVLAIGGYLMFNDHQFAENGFWMDMVHPLLALLLTYVLLKIFVREVKPDTPAKTGD